MDTTVLRQAYRDFLAVAGATSFARPPDGEWSAQQLLAHIVAADTGIAAIALGVGSGQRPTYDNRYSLDIWNLERLMDQTPDLPEMVDLVCQRGELLCQVAEQLSESEQAAPVHCLILSGCRLIADTAQPLGQLIQGVAAVHLPRHASQLTCLITIRA